MDFRPASIAAEQGEEEDQAIDFRPSAILDNNVAPIQLLPKNLIFVRQQLKNYQRIRFHLLRVWLVSSSRNV